VAASSVGGGGEGCLKLTSSSFGCNSGVDSGSGGEQGV